MGVLSPLITRAIGILATLIGVLLVRGYENNSSSLAVNSGFIGTTVYCPIFLSYRALDYEWHHALLAQVMCMAGVFAIVIVVQYYTEIKTNLFKILPVTLRAAWHWVFLKVFPATRGVLSGELPFKVSSSWLDIGWAAVTCKVFAISPHHQWASKKWST